MRKSSFRLRPLQRKLKVRNQGRIGQASTWANQLLPRGMGKNTESETLINRVPIIAIAALCGVILIVLFLQLLNLQLVEGERMRGIAEGNRVREQITYAPRGEIVDRNGVVLATNAASYQLSVLPYLLPDTPKERQRLYAEVATAMGGELTVEEIESEVAEEGLSSPQKALLAEGISHERALKLEYILPQLPGFEVESVPVREYKSDAALAHILGYVGRVSSEDLEERPGLNPTDFIGKQGVEDSYDAHLRGENGVIETEVDAHGRPLRTLRETETKPGQELQLSIDYELQKQFVASLKKYIDERDVDSGSGVIMHPETGEILAMASIPVYNNNAFRDGIDQDRYQSLVQNPQQPMLNRAVSGAYPTGSTIKPITLIGALETGVVNENTIIHDRGSISVTSQYNPGQSFTFEGWNPSGLGPMNARRAIAMSSNIYFYTVAGGHRDFQGMGVDNLVEYYQKFGLGTRTGVDLPNETNGHVPTPEWKEEQTGESWYVGDTYNLSIGQGDLLVSPLQLARGYAAIINGGTLPVPHVAENIDGEAAQGTIDVRGKHLQITREGMRQVVDGTGTTSPSVFADVSVPVAGKSGTAETAPNVRDPHAWYGAYAPYGEDPELVSTVILEEGEGGSQYAAPVIAEAFEQYFK